MANKENDNKRKTILIADASHTLRLLLRGYLKGVYDVIEAESGKEVLAMMAQHHACDSHCIKDAKSGGNQSLIPNMNDSCDAKGIMGLVLGLELPDYNAIEVTERLRKSFHSRCLPIIISTSTNNRETVLEALSKGVNDIIIKPFPRELLVSKLHKLERDIPLHDMKLSELIAQIPFFNGVPVSQVAYLLDTCSETISMEKGEAICQQDDANYDLFVLVEGKCGVFFNKKRVAEIIPVDTIGEMGFIANSKRSASVIADAQSKVIVINKQKFDDFLNEERAISEMILKNIILSLNDRIKKSNALINKLKVIAEEYLAN